MDDPVLDATTAVNERHGLRNIASQNPQKQAPPPHTFRGAGSLQCAFTHADSLTDGIVFAADAGSAKQFYVLDGGIRALYDYLFSLSVTERSYYEVVRYQEPARLYFDLDLKGAQGTGVKEKMDAIEQSVIEVTLASLKNDYNLDVATDRIIALNSDGTHDKDPTLYKASRHLVFPEVYFADNDTHMKTFVKTRVLPKIPEALDTSVYTKTRQMRFFGHHKIGSARVLKSPLEDGTPARHWDLFKDAYISSPPSHGTRLLRCTAASQRGGAVRPPKRQKTNATLAPTAPRAPPVAIRAWVQALIEANEDAVVQHGERLEDGRLRFTCVRTRHEKMCRLGGTHKSQNFSVTVDPTNGSVIYFCHGNLTGHRAGVGPNGEPERWMRLPETLPEALRTKTASAVEALPANKKWLVEQATRNNDIGYAKVYAKVHGRKNVLIISPKGYGYIWTERTKLWRRVTKEQVINDVQRVLFGIYEAVSATIPPPPKSTKKRGSRDDEEEDPHKHERNVVQGALFHLGRQRNLMGVLRQLSDPRDCDHSHGLCVNKDFTKSIDASPFEFPMKGGTVVDFLTLQVRARTQDDLWTWEAKATFLPNYDCALPKSVYSVLADIEDHPERGEYERCLQTMAGSVLCADTGARCLINGHGVSGSNGKSEVGRQLGAVAPDTAFPIQKGLILKSKWGSSGSGPSPELACLMSKRIVTLGDTCDDIVLNEGSIRSLVGGDVLYARGLNENPHPFTMLGKPMFFCNSEAKFDVTKEDLRGKIKYYPFTHKYVKTRESDALCKSYTTTHLDEFFTYFVYGAHDYAENGLRTCPWLEGERAKFLVKINPIGNFVKQMCVCENWQTDAAGVLLEPKKLVSTTSRDLFDAYTEWVIGDNGYERTTKPVSFVEFGRLLTPVVGPSVSKRIDPDDRKKKVWCRLGIRLKTDQERVV